MKIKPTVENFSSTEMILFAEWCGWTLARAHSRDGEPAVIGGYLGKNEVFDKAIAAFAIAYANQTERDYELVKKAASKGKLEVAIER
jgi:NAD(P)H-dependent flavin oxidoreductase YrpB (nitropropane dioxygenase family)